MEHCNEIEDVPEEKFDKKFTDCTKERDGKSLYDFQSEDIWKLHNFSLSEFTGQVVLVVNLASFWGSTPQYFCLNALIEKYSGEKFQVLGFPCNQFGLQEPGANAREILATLQSVRPGGGFFPNFKMFSKTEVNGKNESAIFTFLKSRCLPPRRLFFDTQKLFYEPLHQNDIRWNFEKILVDHKGQPFRRYEPSVKPTDLIPDIDALLLKTKQSDKKQKH